MRIVNTSETFAGGDTFNFYPISDTHLGAAECDEVELRRFVSMIAADPLARWGHGGDIGDLITPKDKRFQAGNVAPRYREKMHRIPDATIEHAVDIFKPIADKCWYIGAGNHESALAAYYDRGIAAEIHAELGLTDRYVGYRGFINVLFNTKGGTHGKSLLIDFHHGWQAGRLYGAFHVEAERTLGHSNAPRAQTRVVACTGTFMHSVKPASSRTDVISEVSDETYAERKGFRPQDPLGPPVIHIKPYQGAGQAHKSAAGQPRFELNVSL